MTSIFIILHQCVWHFSSFSFWMERERLITNTFYFNIWTMACFGLNICILHKINIKSQIHSYDLLFLSLTLFFCFKATLKFSNSDMLSTFSAGKANFPTHILTVSVTSLHISGPFSTWCSIRTVGMGAPG